MKIKNYLGDFTYNEVMVIRELSQHWYHILLKSPEVMPNPPALFKMLAYDCWLKNKDDTATKALRRALFAFEFHNVNRHTEEFENLIKL